VSARWLTCWRTWELGAGLSLPSVGRYVLYGTRFKAVRPWQVVLYLGPWTLEIEGEGREDIPEPSFYNHEAWNAWNA
jgi:hypothetical protein